MYHIYLYKKKYPKEEIKKWLYHLPVALFYKELNVIRTFKAKKSNYYYVSYQLKTH